MSMTETQQDGKVVAIAGPVVDVEFPPDALPEINALLEMDIVLEGETITVAAEVAQQVAMMGLPPDLWTSPLYEEILPKAVALVRPDVPYTAHSPGGGLSQLRSYPRFHAVFTTRIPQFTHPTT